MKHTAPHTGFTLVEVIVALTIFSITMVSVMTIFYLASQMSTRVELNRHMQENIKNTLDIIAEDVRKNTLQGGEGTAGNCNAVFAQGETSSKLCISTDAGTFEYTLGKKESDGSFYKDYDCLDIAEDICYILKKEGSGDYYPLTNSMSHITRLVFTFGNPEQPKVMLTLGVRPALGKGMASNLIEAQEIIVQSTFSERFIQQN